MDLGAELKKTWDSKKLKSFGAHFEHAADQTLDVVISIRLNVDTPGESEAAIANVANFLTGGNSQAPSAP